MGNEESISAPVYRRRSGAQPVTVLCEGGPKRKGNRTCRRTRRKTPWRNGAGGNARPSTTVSLRPETQKTAPIIAGNNLCQPLLGPSCRLSIDKWHIDAVGAAQSSARSASGPEGTFGGVIVRLWPWPVESISPNRRRATGPDWMSQIKRAPLQNEPPPLPFGECGLESRRR